MKSKEFLGCPSCKGERTVGFNWKMAEKGKIPGLDYVPSLRYNKNLKFGKLYSCTKCNTNWFLNEEDGLMSLIPKTLNKIVDEWNRRVLIPPERILKKLKSIGATPPDRYGNMQGYICVPCKCTTKENKAIDLCIVSFQKEPPIWDFYRDILLIDDIVDISESEYALRADVRIATAAAEEVSMGLAPTLVGTRNGRRFIVNSHCNFFKLNEYKGRDLYLINERIPLDEEIPVYNEKTSEVTWIVADWKKQFTKLYLI